MNLLEIIQEYKLLTAICYNVDYSDKKSVKKNNKAVDRMYELVGLINSEFGIQGINEFAQLLNVKENRTDLWVAIHLLEKTKLDKDSENKALQIISDEAKTSIGMEYWLKNFYSKIKE